jgi:hypothetical protein
MEAEELRRIQEEISGYMKAGWVFDEDSSTFYDSFLYSPRGFCYRISDLQLHICTICVDDDECLGLHNEEDLKEEEKAREISGLLRSKHLSELEGSEESD